MKILVRPKSVTDELLVNILRRARGRLASGKAFYICWAVRDAGRASAALHPHAVRGAKYLQAYVMLQLSGCRTLNDWIYTRTGRWPSSGAARITRLLWIDWMIEQLTTPPQAVRAADYSDDDYFPPDAY